MTEHWFQAHFFIQVTIPKCRFSDAPVIVKTPWDYSSIAKKCQDNRLNIVHELEYSNKQLKADKDGLIGEKVKLEENNKELHTDKAYLLGEKDELEKNNKQLNADKHRLLAEPRLH